MKKVCGIYLALIVIVAFATRAAAPKGAATEPAPS